MIRRLGKIWRYLLYGGFRGLRPYELEILEVAAAALIRDEGQTLQRQIALIERAQRWSGDRMVIIGFGDKDVLPRLPADAGDYCLAKVRLKNGSRTVTARVMTHRGILSSLEFRSPPGELLGPQICFEVVETHGAEHSVSELIDDEEHRVSPG